MSDVQYSVVNSDELGSFLTSGVIGSRPLWSNKRTGEVQIRGNRGMKVNSVLRKDEWEELDQSVIMAARQPLNLTEDLRRAGLVRTLGGIGTLTSQWNYASDMTRPSVTMTGVGQTEKDRIDHMMASVPVPVISKEFDIELRALEASRRLGNGIDTTNAEAASRSVVEEQERIAIDGNANIVLNGGGIFGITNESHRNTATAAAYGGGDFGTITNILPTILGQIGVLRGDSFYGPYNVYIAPTQYSQCEAVYTDGSGDRALDRILRVEGVQSVKINPLLADGECTVIQMTSDVIDLAYVPAYWPVTTVEWTSGDGMLVHFKAMAIGVPRIKFKYGGESGISHATAA